MSGPRIITAGPSDAGQKLTQFLARLVGKDVPKSALMRWIRTGQVRVDGRRSGPYDRVEEGQAVRVPPFFAADATWTALAEGASGASSPIGHVAPTPPSGPVRAPAASASGGAPPQSDAASRLPILLETGTLLVLNKPAGLPVHPGSGWTDSVQTRLSAQYAGAAFTPTLAHRLDRDTSGLLLAAKTYRTLAALHEAFRSREVVKIYLAWVSGDWKLSPVGQAVEMRDALAKAGPQGKQKVHTGQGKAARLEATPLVIEKGRALLAIRLFTGRTHQIRAQLSSRGHPIVGDGKYGGQSAGRTPPQGMGRMPMLLHAWKLSVDGMSFCAPPPWPKGWLEAVPKDEAESRGERQG